MRSGRHHLIRRATVIALITSATLLVGGRGEVSACTTFCLRDGGSVLFGRNYDFDIGEALILVNKRDVAKVSSVGDGPPARWTSRYGSVTFNQFGREFPTGGINEKGLVVELMWLAETRYPAADERPALGVLEWIQYQLDTRASVSELLAGAEEVRIRGGAPLHYLVADPSGAAASIEYLDGRLVVHTGPDLPVGALTNDTYEASLAHVRGERGDVVGRDASHRRGSLDRFSRADAMVRDYASSRREPGVSYAFRILGSVSQGERTRWSIVYDMTERVVRFRTWNHPAVRMFRLDGFDFACGSPVRMLDIAATLQGDVTGRFSEYSSSANRDLVLGSYRRVPFLANVPREEIERAARHADGMRCVE